MIVEKAREYLGTPFHHQGRVKGVGIDCIGLLVGVANELGLQHEDFKQYGERPDPRQLLYYISRSCDRTTNTLPGDILLFWFIAPNYPQHAGIATDRGFIHTFRTARKVVEQPWTSAWKKHLYGVYRYRWQP